MNETTGHDFRVATSKKIYVFHTGESPKGFSFVALAQDGTCLVSCLCDSVERAKVSMKTPEKIDCYAKHFPEGYELVWRGGPVTPETFPETFPEAFAGQGASRVLIEGSIRREFLRALTV